MSDTPKAKLLPVHTLPTARDFQDRPELHTLCDWYQETAKWPSGGGVVALVGIGGAGKTALVDKFLRNLHLISSQGIPDEDKDQRLPTPTKTFVFSIYTTPDASAFLTRLYSWFRLESQVPVQDGKPPEAMILELYSVPLTDNDRFLIIIDGLEKLQAPGYGPTLGTLKDENLSDLLKRIAGGWLPHFYVVITTRLPIPELDPYVYPNYRVIPVGDMNEEALVKLIEAKGIKATRDTLRQMVQRCGNHALTVDIGAGYVREFHGGDPTAIFSVLSLENSAEDVHEELDESIRHVILQQQRLLRLAQHYRETLRTHNFLALNVLECVCLSYRDVSAASIQRLQREWHDLKRRDIRHRIREYMSLMAAHRVDDAQEIAEFFRLSLQSGISEVIAKINEHETRFEATKKRTLATLTQEQSLLLSSIESRAIDMSSSTACLKSLKRVGIYGANNQQKALKIVRQHLGEEPLDTRRLKRAVAQYYLYERTTVADKLNNKKESAINGVLDKIMYEAHYTPNHRNITSRAIERCVELLMRLSLIQRTHHTSSDNKGSPNRYAAHIALREPFFRGLPPDLQRTGHSAAVSNIQVELPVDYRGDVTTLIFDYRFAELVGRTKKYPTSDIEVIKSCAEMVQHLWEAGRHNDALSYYLYVLGGHDSLRSNWEALKLGFDIVSQFFSRPGNAPVNADALYDYSKYLRELGRADRALDFYWRSAREFAVRGTERLAAECYLGMAQVLLDSGSIHDAKNVLRLAEEAVPNPSQYITEDNRTYPDPAPGIRKGINGLSSYADFLGGENTSRQYRYDELNVWCCSALLSERSRDIGGKVDRQLGELTQYRRDESQSDVVFWQLLQAARSVANGDLVAARTMMDSLKESVERDLSRHNRCLYAMVCARLNRVKCSAEEDGDKRKVLVEEARRRIAAAIEICSVAEYNLPAIDVLNELSLLEMMLGGYRKAAWYAVMALYGIDCTQELMDMGFSDWATEIEGWEVHQLLATRRVTESGWTTGFLGAVRSHYTWGEASSRHLLGEALVRYSCAMSGESDFSFSERDVVDPRFQPALGIAIEELKASRILKEKLQDPTIDETAYIVDTGIQGIVPIADDFVLAGKGSAKNTSMALTITSVRVPADSPTDQGTPSMPNPESKSTPVFVSYSHRDKHWLERLQVHLKPLERAGEIDLWDDTRILPGGDWKTEIDRALAAARVAVLLISADFLASKFIHDKELPVLLEAAEKRGTRMLPVILGHCLYAESPLGRFQAINAPDRPLEKLPKADRDKILSDLARAIAAGLSVNSAADGGH